MKIAIITYSRAYNYGSALQSFALNRYLTLQGHEVKTIDYTTPEQEAMYTIFEPLRGVLPLFRNLQSIWFYRDLKKHKQRFDSFLDKYVPMTERITETEGLKELNPFFDYFICGSDQIWNTLCDDYNTNYMLSFVTDKHKCIAYAPSLGSGAYDINSATHLNKYVSEFKALSSRESGSNPIIRKATSREVSSVLDPVFLLSAEEWEQIEVKNPVKGDYILGYFIGDVEGMRDFAHRMSKHTKLPVIVIYKNLRDLRYPFTPYYAAGPSDFVSLIRGSKYIVTNSFHAVSFSLIFKKDFWAFVKKGSNDTRVSDILSLVNLNDRVLNDVNQFESFDYTTHINFSKVDFGKLDKAIEQSKIFLKENI